MDWPQSKARQIRRILQHMGVSVCPPVVLLVCIRVIPLTSSGQCWSTAEELHQFAVLVCHRENNRSLPSFFPILIPLNPSNGFVIPFSLFSFYTDWKLKAMSDPKPARPILFKGTQRHVLTWYSRVRLHSTLKHNILHEIQRQTVMPRLPTLIWKKAIWLFSGSNSRWLFTSDGLRKKQGHSCLWCCSVCKVGRG